MAERDDKLPSATMISTIVDNRSDISESPKKSQGSTPSSSSQKPKVPPHSANDFIFGKVLGEGSFSTVYLAKDVNTNREYAIKVCDKRHIINEKKTKYVTREKKALNFLSQSPFIVNLYLTFQDTRSLYFVLTYARNGDLLQLIKKVGPFDLPITKFYTCQIIIALESLKANEILHRDLKPENILLDEHFDILLTDFGSCKLLNPLHDDTSQNRKYSFVGTANYVCPELLANQPLTYTCDLWALGCIIYQMLTGKHCFYGGSEYLTLQKVQDRNFEYPPDFPNEAREFLEKLLVLDGEARLGANDLNQYVSIRNDEFFNGINWDCLGESPIIKLMELDDVGNESDETDCFKRAQPGLGQDQMARLMGLETRRASEDGDDDAFVIPDRGNRRSICDISEEVLERKLSEQRKTNKYHDLAEGNLILKQGFIEKKKGLIPRRRMFLLTLGPHIYYIEPNTMVLKGQVPWTQQLRVEVKNFQKFDIVTPNRTYNLEDPEGFALKWKQAIEDIHEYYFKNNP